MNLTQIISALVLRGNATVSSIETKDSHPTSVRLKPETRRFLQAQATVMNTSLSALIETILDGVSESTQRPVNAELRTIRERFSYVFEAHGIDITNTASICSAFGITPSTLGAPERLTDLLTAKTLRYVAQTFAVEEDWLHGKDADPIGTAVQWYNGLGEPYTRLTNYHRQGLSPYLYVLKQDGVDLEQAIERDYFSDPEIIGVIVSLHRMTDDHVPFTTYEKWQFDKWNYWKVRRQLKKLIMFCEVSHFARVTGLSVTHTVLQGLKDNQLLPAEVFRQRLNVSWSPYDYVCFDDPAHLKDGADIPEIKKEVDEMIEYARQSLARASD